MKVILSWTNSCGGPATGGSVETACWESTRCHLVKLEKQSGTLCLDVVDAPNPGPVSMQVIAESGKYVITILQAIERDTFVRTYTNPSATAEMVEVLGDRWDARQLTRDFDLVLNLFKMFSETGDVPAALLS